MLCMVTLVWSKIDQYRTQYTMDQIVIDAINQHEALGIALSKNNPTDGKTLFMRSSVNIEEYILNAPASDNAEE